MRSHLKQNEVVKHESILVNEIERGICVDSNCLAITNSSFRCDGVCLCAEYLSNTDRRIVVSEANLGYIEQATVSEKSYC